MKHKGGKDIRKITYWSKKGMSFFSVLVVPLIITLIITGVAIYLSLVQPKPEVPLSTLISVDYHVESSVILHLHKQKNKADNELQLYEKEILPDVKLSMTGKRQKSNIWHFNVKVTGRDINREYLIAGSVENPDKLVYLNK